MEVKRSYEFYLFNSKGVGGVESYYRLVTDAFRKAMAGNPDYDDCLFDFEFLNDCYHERIEFDSEKAKRDRLTSDFQQFDDGFLREFAGWPSESQLPLKSNEVFDSTYLFQMISWYYLPCNSPDSYLDMPMQFLKHVEAGHLISYSEFYQLRK